MKTPLLHWHQIGIDGPACSAFNWRSKSQAYKTTDTIKQVNCRACLTRLLGQRKIRGWRVLPDSRGKVISVRGLSTIWVVTR